MELPTPWLLLGIVLALLALGVALIGWWRATGRTGRANRARQQIAATGEARAEQVLRRSGYRVVDRQVTARWTLWIDGEAHEVSSRADLLVTRSGRSFVAEVKTGGRAPDPRHPATRRQLLEYLLAFPVHGVLLVDMEAHRIHQVDFPPRGEIP